MRGGDGKEEMSRRDFLRRIGQTAVAAGAATRVGKVAAAFAATKPAMQYRPLGKTGHHSSILCFGGVMLADATQQEADEAVGYALEHGVNHIDVGPSYGDAELRLGPALQGKRDKVFLACKTLARTRKEAEAELHQSQQRLKTEHFDLYEFHALNTMDELEQVMAPGGAWELFQEAKAKGWARFLGVTGHRPSTLLEAVKRMPLDTVMCPVNFIEEEHTHAPGPLLDYAEAHGLGAIAIKAISTGQWGEKKHAYGTWYRPFDDQEHIDKAFRYTLSQKVTTAAAAGDIRLLKMLVSAAERFAPMPAEEQRTLVAMGAQYKALFEEA